MTAVVGPAPAPDALDRAIQNCDNLIANLQRDQAPFPAANPPPDPDLFAIMQNDLQNIWVNAGRPRDPQAEGIQPACEFNNRVSRIALGALVWAAEFPVLDFLENRVSDLMKSFGMERTADQEVVAIFKYFDGSTSWPLVVLYKTALAVYIVVIGPIFEEYLFRHLLQNYTHWLQGSDALSARVLRVLGNGVVFGAAHLSPFQGYTNIPVFLFTFILGCIMAAQREITGDIVSSSTTHMLHNGTAMLQLLMRA